MCFISDSIETAPVVKLIAVIAVLWLGSARFRSTLVDLLPCSVCLVTTSALNDVMCCAGPCAVASNVRETLVRRNQAQCCAVDNGNSISRYICIKCVDGPVKIFKETAV